MAKPLSNYSPGQLTRIGRAMRRIGANRAAAACERELKRQQSEPTSMSIDDNNRPELTLEDFFASRKPLGDWPTSDLAAIAKLLREGDYPELETVEREIAKRKFQAKIGERDVDRDSNRRLLHGDAKTGDGIQFSLGGQDRERAAAELLLRQALPREQAIEALKRV